MTNRSTVDPRVFRTYDIRALVPDLVDETSVYYGRVDDPDAFQAPLTHEGVELIGRGLADFFGSPAVAVGRDSRLSSPGWAAALASGLARQGVDVIDIGLSTTDMVYFASGWLDVPAVEITASHCTGELNGMKIVRAGAQVVGRGSGMEELSDLVLSERFRTLERPGGVQRRTLLNAYVDHLLRVVDATRCRPFRIVADAGNGVAGMVARALLTRLLQVEAIEMYFEPDGRFPNHEANPFERHNVEELIHRVPAEQADFGVAWDGDADRVFFFDETGEPVPGDFVTALVARAMLARAPGSAIVYDLRASWAVRDWVTRLGGRPVSERVGHSFIKRTMRAENAVFGGEVSGHYYFRDHYFADNGFLPLLCMLQICSDGEMPLSRRIAEMGDYFVSGEINSTVADPQAVADELTARYASGQQDVRDGVTVEFADWKFNVRPSANDPVLRLNVEARTRAAMEARRDELLAVIRQ